MNRQQALNQLRIMQAWHEDNGNGPCPDYDAICYAINIIEPQPEELDTLIKALEQEHRKLREMQKTLKNVHDTNVGDTISRQAAIDAILHITNCKSVRELFEYNQLHHLTEMWSGGVNDAIDAVIGVDSAQLGTNLAEVGTEERAEERTETHACDCISRQATVNALIRWLDDEDDARSAFAVIEQMPPAQPEIIRCKNCKHWIPYDWMFSEVWQSKNIADYPEDEIGCNYCDMAMKANDFCSRAERRTDE